MLTGKIKEYDCFLPPVLKNMIVTFVKLKRSHNADYYIKSFEKSCSKSSVAVITDYFTIVGLLCEYANVV